MRIVLTIISFLFCLNAGAKTKYVMVKGGISVYADTTAKSKIIATLPYGTAIQDTFDYTAYQSSFKNYSTFFVPVMTPAGKGYVPDAYLLPFPPPKNNVSSVDSYLAQLSEPMGIVDSFVTEPMGEYNASKTYIKKVYKNGAVYEHSFEIYDDYYSVTFPNLSIEKAYVLMQLFYIHGGYFPPAYDYPTIIRKNLQVDERTVRSIKPYKGKYDRWMRLVIDTEDSAVLNTLEFIQAGKDVIVIKSSSI